MRGVFAINLTEKNYYKKWIPRKTQYSLGNRCIHPPTNICLRAANTESKFSLTFLSLKDVSRGYEKCDKQKLEIKNAYFKVIFTGNIRSNYAYIMYVIFFFNLPVSVHNALHYIYIL